MSTLKKKKKEKISTWKKKADKVFSLFIRKRDAEFGGSCITCGKWFDYDEMDAGHFISRNCLQLRYNEKNVNAQCRGCNRFRSGEQALYVRGLDSKYKKGTADKLLDIYMESKKNIQSFPVEFYQDIYHKYKKI